MLCESKKPSDAVFANSLYKRPLPSWQVPLSSAQGRLLFQEALLAGSTEAFFPLIEQFQTQVEPTYCGISSLVMVLNALQVDPKRPWKGVWRWFSEDIADCCHQLEVINKKGITLTALAQLARCNGLDALAVHADAQPENLETFRRQVVRICSAVASDGQLSEAMVVSYSRAVLEQSGDGHFSPVGGYHAVQDAVLLLDVARFKYPPHWVPLPRLWQAMRAVDRATGLARGYLQLQTSAPATAQCQTPNTH